MAVPYGGFGACALGSNSLRAVQQATSAMASARRSHRTRWRKITEALAAGALLSAIFAARIAQAAVQADEDKCRYTLFNPTPDRLLRNLTTDRPDKTETPFTVDAGRLQVEASLFGYARSSRDVDGTVSHFYEFAPTNFRIGLTSWSEINFVFQPYGIVRTHPLDPLTATRSSGTGAFDIRAKFNLWGNDTFEKPGATALGLLPFVRLPTDHRNGISPEAVEGGLIVPFAVKLTDGFSLGLNAGVYMARNSDSSGYHAEHLASASLCYEWSESFATYYEVAARMGARDPRGDIVVLATGVTYKLNKNLQLDAGVNFGVTSAADRINPFVGISARF
jgi:hypothetical protein